MVFVLGILTDAKDARSDFAHMQRLLRQQEVLLYHGNKDKGMEPKYGAGGSANDYGPGFYTTDDIRLAKEWAWCRYTNGLHGYVHTYKIKLSGLNILNYSAMDSLHWVAEIVSNRPVNLEYRSGTIRTMQRFIHRYKLDTSSYDLIVGYRADDSYFSYVTDFMTGALMREDLDKALRFGNLGTQICVKSERAFGLLERVKVEEVPRSFEVSYKNREKKASSDYRQLISSAQNLDGMHTINDYI